MIANILRNNIFRESNSSFASSVILVKKKDGGDRLCVDFSRRLYSENCVRNARWPLRVPKSAFWVILIPCPNINEGLHSLE